MNYRFQLCTYRDNSDDDLNVVVEFDYQPREKATSTYPGCSAEVTLCSVFDTDIRADVLHNLLPSEKDRIIEACFEYISEQKQ